MNTDQLEAKVYIPAGETGNIEVPFDRRHIKDLDTRIKLTTRESYLTVFVDEKISKDVDLREVLVGAPAEGFFIERVIITPPRIKVTGIKADVLKLDEIPTEPIDISKLNQSKSFEVGIATSEFTGSAFETDRVRVKIQLGDSKVNKRFSAIPVEVVGSEYIADVRPGNVSIVIQGTPGVLSFVNKEDLRAFIELTNMGPGRYEKEIQVKIPPDTVLIETSPTKGVVEIYNQKRVN
jgi:YbbR domain-containing protein